MIYTCHIHYRCAGEFFNSCKVIFNHSGSATYKLISFKKNLKCFLGLVKQQQQKRKNINKNYV